MEAEANDRPNDSAENINVSASIAHRNDAATLTHFATSHGPEQFLSARWPYRISREEFYSIAYPWMIRSRRFEQRLVELYQKGYVKGTVTMSFGNEAAAVGMALPLRPGQDPVSLLHRDLAAHLIFGSSLYQLACQYMANAESPTGGYEGNVHHGDAAARRYPMISHLGKMLSITVGAVWAARRGGERVFGLDVIGDGGTSTGEFHESLNMASIHKAPVLFLIENNRYAFSTPTSAQYACQQLSDRAIGYGIEGRSIDGTDAWTVYSSVCDALDWMDANSLPMILECNTLRLCGHAVYDKGQYVPAKIMDQWRQDDPLVLARRRLSQCAGMSEQSIVDLETKVDDEVNDAIRQAMAVGRPRTHGDHWPVHAPAAVVGSRQMAVGREEVLPSASQNLDDAAEGNDPADADEHIVAFPGKLEGSAQNGERRNTSLPTAICPLPTFAATGVKNGDAVNLALDYILSNRPAAFLAGMDVGVYGSAFKTCKGLIEKYGAERVIDMPICESAIVGFALGASQIGAEPIIEFQFSDFSTEAVSQLGMNVATWYFRTQCPAPLLLRLPCGGGLTMGAFHSGEFEGLWSRFPGLKLLYPATPQETFEAILAGFYDPNPCLVFENKQLYWSRSGDIQFDGNLSRLWQPRRYTEGNDLTVVALGAMVHHAVAAAAQSACSADIWNPFALQPLVMQPIVDSVRRTGRLLVVQESGETQGLGDRLISLLTRECFHEMTCPPQLVAAPDSPVPFAPELEAVYRPSMERIRKTMVAMTGGDSMRRVA